MRLDDIEESKNVEDRRSSRGGFGGSVGGGMSIGRIMMLWPIIRMLLRTKFGWALLAIGAFFYFGGFNPLSSARGGGSKVTADDEKKAVFIKKVLATTESVWSNLLPKYGIRYTKPELVLYRGHTTSGCGFASAQMGPFYCPSDKKVYLDLGFFDELARRHNSPGDFAQAYVLAHEIGHHVQDLQGTLDKVQQIQHRWGGSSKRANALQVRVELQADCYAGVWANHAQKQFGVLEPGDIEEALRAASSIGDDTLQKQSQGYVVPDSFTHGSSKQRVEWFYRGLKSGDLRSCNTFN